LARAMDPGATTFCRAGAEASVHRLDGATKNPVTVAPRLVKNQ